MLEGLCIPAKYLLGGAVVTAVTAVGLFIWAWSELEVDPEGPLTRIRELEGWELEEDRG